jgi:hypothetical protein
MFYKYEEEYDIWSSANKISFPDGVTLSVDNKIEKDGWYWSDVEPEEYTVWLELEENN